VETPDRLQGAPTFDSPRSWPSPDEDLGASGVDACAFFDVRPLLDAQADWRRDRGRSPRSRSSVGKRRRASDSSSLKR